MTRVAVCRWTVSLALLIGTATSGALAGEDLASPEYSLKQSGPSTGTNISRKIVQGSAIPLNRSYAQLTDDEKRIVRSWYESMDPLDEPPFPVAGLKAIHQAIANVQQKLLEQGLLSMQAEVDATGAVTSVSVYRSPDPRMTQAAASVLMLTPFKPAVCHGQPCKMSFPLRVSFKVE